MAPSFESEYEIRGPALIHPPMTKAMQNRSSSQSAEILARRDDFVPTALNAPETAAATPPSDWQTAMKRAVRSSAELRRILDLPAARGVTAEQSFPTFVPWEFIRRIRPGDENDPLLKQVLPQPGEDSIEDEQDDYPAFSADPVGDLDAAVASGLLHKYHGRALMITSGACGVHCRYCFRREFPYSQVCSSTDQWRPAVEYIRRHTEIDEVLLSGGDPLTMVDSSIERLMDAIESIPHVRRLRIHSRMPIVIPQRLTKSLVSRLTSSRLAIWFVVHVNHPNELDADLLARLGALVRAGIPVLNQAVLLRGVNDDAATLIELCRKLVDHRIQPYYLHQLDRVRGASHFEVSVAKGTRLMRVLRASLPGYAVPTYVREEPGADSKTLLPISRELSGKRCT